MANYKVNDVPLSNLIEQGGSSDAVTKNYNILGTPIKYISPNVSSFESPSALGYKLNGVDIANSVVAVYNDYTGNTTLNSGDIPSWCTKLRVILIGGGGGGGGGGGDPGGWDSQSIGVSGAGGGGGGLVAGIITTANFAAPYKIVVGTGGNGGTYQDIAENSGYFGSAGNESSFSYNTNTVIMTAEGGTQGTGAEDPNTGNNYTNGAYGGGANANIPTVAKLAGNDSATAYDGYGYDVTNAPNHVGPSKGGTVKYDANVPQIATNVTVTTTDSINRPNLSDWANKKAGYGQGGMGGINANSNGYAGQPGGNGLVRIYFIK